MSRTRTRDLRVAKSGTLFRYGLGTFVKTAYNGWRSQCTDVVGNKSGDNPLDLWHAESHTPVMNGANRSTTPPYTLYSEFKECPVTRTDNAEDPKTYWDGVDGSFLSRVSAISLRVTRETSPSQPHIAIGQSLYELKDLPSLVRTKGMSWLAVVPAGHLSWRFAIAPMISDTRKLLAFQLATLRRYNYLRKLATGRWVRRTITIGRGTVSVSKGSQLRQSEAATVTCAKNVVYTKREWCSTSWKLDPDAFSAFKLPPDRRDLWHYAQRLCAGVNSYGALQAAWELMPWSWLADWFLPISDYIASGNNTVPAFQSSCCFMRESTSYSTYSSYSKPTWMTISGKDFQYMVRRERYVFNPNIPYLLPPTIPFLEKRQLSILTSLGILKGIPLLPLKFR